ncbi:hypothetical protein PQX77_015466, partial [Marasmius sp. AFHP31]
DDDSVESDYYDSEDEVDPAQEEYERIMSMIDREKLKRENPGLTGLKFYDALFEAYEKLREELGLPPDGEKSTETASVCTRDMEMYELPVFNVSYDLSEVDCVNAPEDFQEELRAFRRLTGQHENARRQREIEKAQQIDEEYFAGKPQGPVAGLSFGIRSSPHRAYLDISRTGFPQPQQPPQASIRLKSSTILSRIKHSFKHFKRFFCM